MGAGAAQQPAALCCSPCTPGCCGASSALLDSQHAVLQLLVLAAEGAATSARQRSHLIVVATLIDKAPNLGGLARTCEIFNAARLVLSSLAVAKRADFQGVSMTAERWLPLQAVSEAELPGWLQV